ISWNVSSRDRCQRVTGHLSDSSSLHLLQVKYDFLCEKVHACCLEEWASPIYQKIYMTFILVILFLLPLIHFSSSTIHGSEMSKISRFVKVRIVTMVTVVFLFAVSWAPFHRIHVMMEYSEYLNNQMIFAIVQIIGFFNSICIVYRQHIPKQIAWNSGMTMRRQKPSASQRDPMDSDEERREAFSDGNTEVRFCDQPAPKRNLKRHLVLFSSELTVHSAVGNGQ
uniref:Uncharacterized protein n=1 Tax=Zosterops lateralis melanops TaxID=1220523 RepID=A0A8D2PX80_ZOSLA